MRWLWLLNRQSHSFLCNKCIRVAYVYRHNLFSLTHTTLLLLVITSPQRVCFCQRTRTFPPVSTDWRQIGGCAVGTAATSDGFISGSTADTAGMLIKGRVGSQMSPLVWKPQSTTVQKYKAMRKRVRARDQSAACYEQASQRGPKLSATFFCSVFHHWCSTEQREKETVSAQRVSPGAPDLRAFITVICSKRQFPSQHKSCAGDTCFVCLSIRLCVEEDFETRSAFSCFSKARKYRKYSNFTPGWRAFISGLEIPADSWH